MLDQLMGHCQQHNLLSDFQSAYQKNNSTETSLLNITNDILWGMENEEITTILILDLFAAFDTMDHDILLAIMEGTSGFKEKALKWLENYLRPRYFKVCIDSKYSQPKNLTFNVSQGSCSGANLFSCYCSLITTFIPNSLDIKEWMDSIRLKLNSDKTKYIQFRSRQQINKIDTSPINANGDLIPMSYSIRYLG